MSELEGYLMKQGVGALGKGFKKRYFKQSGQAIHYYKDKKDAQDLGKISLAEAISVQNVESKDGKFHFQINTPRRIWHLCADTEDSRSYWVDGISGLIEKSKSQEIADGRRSVRVETMENRIRDLESRDAMLKKALELAAKKLAVNVDDLLQEADTPSSSSSSSSAEPAAAPAAAVAAAEPAKKEEKKESEPAAEPSSSSSSTEGGETKPKRFLARVLYDYTAQQDYEMTIRVNEEITVLSKHGNGWWLGATVDGKQGYFPGSYVDPIDE